MNDIANTADNPQRIARVVKVENLSIPGLPGMHVHFDNGYTLSIIQPLTLIGSKILEIACWNDNTNWIRNPHWDDDIYRVRDLNELNSELAQLIPGYQPILFPGILAIDE